MAGVLLETMSKKQIIIFTLTALLSLAIFFILGGTKGELDVHAKGKYFSTHQITWLHHGDSLGDTGRYRVQARFMICNSYLAEFSSLFGTSGRVNVDE